MKKTSGFFSLLISTIFALGLMMHAVCAQIDSDGDGLSDEWEQGVGRYQVVDGSFTWEQANENAQARGGHLATFTSAAEWEAFLSLYGSGVLSETRIGMETSNTAPSGYRWVTDETGMFFNWAPEQPNGSFETTVVLYSYATGCVWHDFSTSNPFPYVLEFGYPTDPFNADTDGDGFNDKVESDNGSDPNNAASTPDLTDRDNDGVNYYREGKDGTDPNDASSFNPLSKGLVAFYPFDGNANDDSGYANNGVAENITFTSSITGNNASAAYFDGTAGVSIQESSSLQLPAQFTLSTWINVATWEGYGGNNGHPIFSAGGIPGSAEQAFGVGLTEWSSDFFLAGQNDYPSNGVVCGSRAYSPLADISNVANAFPTTKLGVSPKQWRMLTWTYDGTTIRSYLDGQLLQSSSYSSTTNISPYIGWNTLRLGFNHGGERLRGVLDGVRIYRRALPQAEIINLFYGEGFTDTQKSFLSGNPEVMGHYSQASYLANRTNGQTDVTTNPAAFNLFTQSQYDDNRARGREDGIADVIVSPTAYGLYDSTSIMDLRMGGLMIQKQGTDATIVFQPQTTTDLATQPFTNNGTPITNAIPMPGDKGFLRVEAIYVPAGDLIGVQVVDQGSGF